MKNKFNAPGIKKATVKPKDEKQIENFIEKGGSAAKSEKSDKKKIQVVNLRIPSEDLEEIDELIKKIKPRTDRHKWILAAVYEKYQRDTK